MPDSPLYPGKFCLINFEFDINVFVSLNCSFSFPVSLRKELFHFWHINNGSRNKQKNDNFFHIFIRLRFLGFQGTVLNRALQSLHGGSLEITLTVTLPQKLYSFDICHVFQQIYIPETITLKSLSNNVEEKGFLRLKRI